MMRIAFYCISLLTLLGCSDNKLRENEKDSGEKVATTDYLAQVDKPEDHGQYWSLEPSVIPKSYYVCPVGGNIEPDKDYPELKKGLPYANMCESLAGIVNRAVERKVFDCAVWLEDPNNRYSYTLCKQELQKCGAEELQKKDGIALLRSGRFSDLIKGYVLTDVSANPESSIVATMASHLYDGIIVDERDRKAYDGMGLKMLYDARKKTTKEAWKEFKDRCSNKALVISGANAHELRDFAIANGLFMLNLKNGNDNNWDVLDEALEWLSPCSPIYGWESFEEHSFVQRITEKGHLMVPCNYYMNMPLTSIGYSRKQEDLLVNVINPKNRVYPENDENKYISYYLSDGDNVQWVFFTWYDEWFKQKHAQSMKMAFGFPSTNLSMIAPPAYKHVVEHQAPENTLVENCGGGYIYIDDFANKKNRTEDLSELVNKVSAHMRQHRVKVLGLFANDVKSAKAQEAYKAFIEANNWLEGVIAVQYHPYNGGRGEIFWFTNSDGVEIPVITVRYTIWDFGKNNKDGQGTPAYIARLLKEEQPDFSLIDVHAWSSFADIGVSEDETGETAGDNKNMKGPAAALLCQRRLPSHFKCVSLQELIWRLRMKRNRAQTMEILEKYK